MGRTVGNSGGGRRPLLHPSVDTNCSQDHCTISCHVIISLAKNRRCRSSYCIALQIVWHCKFYGIANCVALQIVDYHYLKLLGIVVEIAWEDVNSFKLENCGLVTERKGTELNALQWLGTMVLP